MSHIGKKPINIPDGVEVDISNSGLVTVKGKLGELSESFNLDLSIEKEDNILTVKIPSNTKKFKELHGLTRSLVANMIEGVCSGYSKELNLVGVGYTADAKGPYLLLNLGYSHPIYFEKPEGITFETPSPTSIIVKGTDKQAVGQVSAKIRSLRKPEPYKGKGVRYSDEVVRRKAGKKVAGAA
jgi:large subunit ribosomal protein L6